MAAPSVGDSIGDLFVSIGMDNSEFNRDMSAFKKSFDDARTSAKGSFGDIARVGGTLKNIGVTVAKFGAGAIGAFTAIAAFSPQAAPHLAKMKADFFRLSVIVGEELEPVFAAMSTSFSQFIGALSKPEGREALRQLGESVSGIITGIGEFVSDPENIEIFAKALKSMSEVLTTISDTIKTINDFGLFRDIVLATVGFIQGGPTSAVRNIVEDEFISPSEAIDRGGFSAAQEISSAFITGNFNNLINEIFKRLAKDADDGGTYESVGEGN